MVALSFSALAALAAYGPMTYQHPRPFTSTRNHGAVYPTVTGAFERGVDAHDAVDERSSTFAFADQGQIAYDDMGYGNSMARYGGANMYGNNRYRGYNTGYGGSMAMNRFGRGGGYGMGGYGYGMGGYGRMGGMYGGGRYGGMGMYGGRHVRRLRR